MSKEKDTKFDTSILGFSLGTDVVLFHIPIFVAM